jgi:hypothetical protein
MDHSLMLNQNRFRNFYDFLKALVPNDQYYPKYIIPLIFLLLSKKLFHNDLWYYDSIISFKIVLFDAIILSFDKKKKRKKTLNILFLIHLIV